MELGQRAVARGKVLWRKDGHNRFAMNNLVRIQDGLAYIGFSGPMNRETLLKRIENISNRRHEYATEDAWVRNLNASKEALAMLDSLRPQENQS